MLINIIVVLLLCLAASLYWGASKAEKIEKIRKSAMAAHDRKLGETPQEQLDELMRDIWHAIYD